VTKWQSLHPLLSEQLKGGYLKTRNSDDVSVWNNSLPMTGLLLCTFGLNQKNNKAAIVVFAV
jgi:hypothetical protein